MHISGFDDVVRERTGADFINREWLATELTHHVAQNRYTVLVGEPGAGKTTVLAGLAREHPDWLRYFIRRDSVTSLVGSDLTTFLLSIGQQLARSRPELFEPQKLEVVVQQRVGLARRGSSVVGIRIEDLVASPFHRTARLTVEQDVARLEGDLTGVQLGRAHMEPRLLEPATLAELALFAPAELLAQGDPDARIVIMIDALDELARDATGSLLEWLIHGPELPANVRVLLAARPNTELGGLRSARDGLAEVTIDPATPDVRSDLEAFGRRNLFTSQVEAAVRVAQWEVEDFLNRVVRRSAGNFLYMAAYTRALVDVVTTGEDPELVAGLINFRDIPEGLYGLYTFFLDTIRREVAGLGSIELADGSWTAAWESVGQSVLGILTVARAPLTPEAIRRLSMLPVLARVLTNVLARMRWILHARNGGYVFFHASVAEYLASAEVRAVRPEWAVEEREWHARIVQSCKRGRAEWSDVDWSGEGDYELLHVAAHLTMAGDGDQVPALVGRPLRIAIRSRFGSDRYVAGVVDLALDQACRGADPAAALPLVWYLSIVARWLRQGERKLSPRVLGLAARMGRTDEALDHALSIGVSEQLVEALAQIVDQASVPDQRRRELAELLVESALLADDAAMATAAVRLARWDPPRALRLAQRGGADPDPVLAAAAAADPIRASEYLARMGKERTTACLDLAAKAGADGAHALVRLAETGLKALEADRRVVELARLARLDPQRRSRHLRRLAADRLELDPSNQYPHQQALIKAATTLAGIDDALARVLLRSVEGADLDQARAWLTLGEPAEARRILDVCLGNADEAGARLQAAGVLAGLDPAAAGQLIGEVAAEVEAMPPPGDLMTELDQSAVIAALVSALAPTAPARAETLARQMPWTLWRRIGHDRATVLATLAAGELDAGRAQSATRLLDELLADAARPGPLAEPQVGAAAVPAGQAVAGGRGAMMHVAYRTNVQNQWWSRVRRRLHTDPADVARAYAPGPSSVGSPYSWARTLRVFATRLGGPDFAAAARLVRLIADPGELLVAQGELFTAAIKGGLPEQKAEYWNAFQKTLDELPAWDWTVRGDKADQGFAAYLRPDLRARFDAAISIMPWEADLGMNMLAGLDALAYLFEMSFACRASDAYLSQMVSGRQPQAELRFVHESVVSTPAGSMSDALIESILRTTVARNERLLTGRDLEIVDPVYRLLDCTRPSPWGLDLPAGPGVELDPRRRPAMAGVVLCNRDNGALGDFATRLHAAAVTAKDYETLIILARADIGDPRALIDELLPQLDGMFYVDRDELLPDLAVLLFRHAPEEALRFLSRAVETQWETAVAVLEFAATDLVELAGPEIGAKLNEALFAAFACCTLDNAQVPETLNGVRRIPA